jgi:hypothetical protein
MVVVTMVVISVGYGGKIAKYLRDLWRNKWRCWLRLCMGVNRDVTLGSRLNFPQKQGRGDRYIHGIVHDPTGKTRSGELHWILQEWKCKWEFYGFD